MSANHGFFFDELLDLLFADFSFNLTLFPFLFRFCLINIRDSLSFRFVGFLLISVLVLVFKTVLIVIISKVLFSSNFLSNKLPKLLNVLIQEITHLRHSKSSNIMQISHRFNSVLLKVKHIIKLRLKLVKSNSVPLNIPSHFFFCFFNLLSILVQKHFKVLWVNVEIVLAYFNDFVLLVIFFDKNFEFLS